MKKIKTVVLPVIIICFGFLCGCDDETLVNCGDMETSKFENIVPWFDYFDAVTGKARFFYQVTLTNDACIEKPVMIELLLKENSPSYITEVTAFALIPDSTPPDFHITKLTDTWGGTENFNLRQGFDKGPGSISVRVYVYITASNETDARWKITSSISTMYIYCYYNRYTP